jgi:perosamine synthetase
MNISWGLPDLNNDDKKSVVKVLESGWFSMGTEVKNFEEKVKTYLGIEYAVAVNNGTSALDLAFKAIDIKPNDEVILPALTYIATGNAVLYNHATPIFVDVDDTLNIDTSLIEDKITDKTKAIVNIDLGGNVSNYSDLLKISKKYKIPLIVDGAQSFGSEFHGRKCCTHGIVNTTSFHAAKILTTIEGGMIFTNDKDIYLKSQSLRNQGESSKYIHEYLGNNYRMTDIAAAIGVSQINRFQDMLITRRLKAAYYKENLKNVEFPRELNDSINCYFFFLILVNNRDKLNNYLNKNGVDTRITYPWPINEQPMFRNFDKKTYSVAKKISNSVISLPMHNKLTIEEQDYIIKKINEFGG